MAKIWIPQDRLAHHTLVVGGTGTRKSSLIRGQVDQALAREWPCVFLDIKEEYRAEYYRPGIDHIINFSDPEGSRWMIGEEAADEPHAYPIGDSAFPTELNGNKFFQVTPRSILTHLIGVHKPSTSKLAQILIDPIRLRRHLVGHEHYETMSKEGGEMGQSVKATLAKFVPALRWLPDGPDDKQFSVRRWAESKKRGNIFLSSTANTFGALKHLHSMILDMVLLALQTHGGPGMIVADEVAQYDWIPQLHRSITVMRSSGVPIILAMQDVPQFKAIYGDKIGESIISNCYTTIILRTKGPQSCKDSADLLGMPAQIERIRESKSAGSLFFHRPHNNYGTERVMEHAITPGEVQSQKDGRGWISQEGNICKINIQWRPAKLKNKPYTERSIKAIPITIERPPDDKPFMVAKRSLLTEPMPFPFLTGRIINPPQPKEPTREYKPKLRGAAPGAASTSAVPVLVPPTVCPQDSPN